MPYEPRHDKTNKMSMRQAKTQISLGIHPVWSESSLCTQWVAQDPRFLHADSEDTDQTGRMPRLIWIFTGRTLILLFLSCRGSYANNNDADYPVRLCSLISIFVVRCQDNILKDFKNASPTILELDMLGLFIVILFVKMFIDKKDMTVLFTKVKFIQLQLKQHAYPTHFLRFNLEEKFKPLGFAKKQKFFLFFACIKS